MTAKLSKLHRTSPEPLMGILAGMGPRSTAPFVDLVVTECQLQYNARLDADFPPIMIYSLPTPFFVDRPIDHDDLCSCVVGGLQKLESTGVALIAIPCNSVHAYYETLQNAVKVPLLNMIELAVAALPGQKLRVSVLATDLTIQSGLYQERINLGASEFVHSDAWQKMVNQLISGIKTGTSPETLTYLWKELVDALTDEHIDAAIIACTDLNHVTRNVVSSFPLIDAGKCLAQELVAKYRQIIAAGSA